jgi:hypothetical protein
VDKTVCVGTCYMSRQCGHTSCYLSASQNFEIVPGVLENVLHP